MLFSPDIYRIDYILNSKNDPVIQLILMAATNIMKDAFIGYNLAGAQRNSPNLLPPQHCLTGRARGLGFHPQSVTHWLIRRRNLETGFDLLDHRSPGSLLDPPAGDDRSKSL
jgi:hypothetical protein